MQNFLDGHFFVGFHVHGQGDPSVRSISHGADHLVLLFLEQVLLGYGRLSKENTLEMLGIRFRLSGTLGTLTGVGGRA